MNFYYKSVLLLLYVRHLPHINTQRIVNDIFLKLENMIEKKAVAITALTTTAAATTTMTTTAELEEI